MAEVGGAKTWWRSRMKEGLGKSPGLFWSSSWEVYIIREMVSSVGRTVSWNCYKMFRHHLVVPLNGEDGYTDTPEYLSGRTHLSYYCMLVAVVLICSGVAKEGQE